MYPAWGLSEGLGLATLLLRVCGLCCRPWAQGWHACPLLGVLLGAKPRWLQERRATATAAVWLFKTFRFPGSTGCRPSVAPEPRWGCCWLLSEGDESWRRGSASLPHAPLPLCHWINDSSFPQPAASPARSSSFLYFKHFTWENPQSLFPAGDL